MRYSVFALFLLLQFPICMAKVENNFTFISSVHEQRFQQLIRELRCLVCQNQNLAESNAPLARDLKKEIYQKIRSGLSNEEIKQYLVGRYGEYILFKPVINPITVFLWGGPGIFLIGSFLILIISVRRQSKSI